MSTTEGFSDPQPETLTDEEIAKAALLYGASVLEKNIRATDPALVTVGIEASVEILRRLAAGEVPA